MKWLGAVLVLWGALEGFLLRRRERLLPLRVGQALAEDLEVLHASKVGRIHTLIMRMGAEEAAHRLAVYEPMLVDAVPLTLEEIFIYELGGADYAVKDIVL